MDVPLRIEFLYDAISERTLKDRLPRFVWEHDNELEKHPLLDYGLVAERTAIPGLEYQPPEDPPEVQEQLRKMREETAAGDREGK